MRNDRQLHVSLVAFPDAVISTLGGIYDVLNSFQMLTGFDDSVPLRDICQAGCIGGKYLHQI